jgi:hypothetical protein
MEKKPYVTPAVVPNQPYVSAPNVTPVQLQPSMPFMPAYSNVPPQYPAYNPCYFPAYEPCCYPIPNPCCVPINPCCLPINPCCFPF